MVVWSPQPDQPVLLAQQYDAMRDSVQYTIGTGGWTAPFAVDAASLLNAAPGEPVYLRPQQPRPARPNQAWLDERVNEMRVKL